MQVKELKNEGLKREFEITLSADDLHKKVEGRLNELARTIKMPGFRPGKVPLDILRKKHGRQILGEVLEIAVADSSEKVLKDEQLNPAMQPKIEISSFDPEKQGSNLVYNLSFEIYPEVPSIDLSKVKVNKSIVDVSDKEVKDGLERLRKGQKNFVPLAKARAAKEGDAVLIDFIGKVNGVAFDGGTAKNFQLELGSKQFIPGYEEQLIGVKKGETRVVKVKFPEAYGSKELAGKESEFEVTVHDILEAELPEADDNLAKKVGFEDLTKLKDAIREQIGKDFEVITRTKLKKEIFDALDETYTFAVPETMVELEFNSINESIAGSDDSKKSSAKEQKEYKKLAERRVRLGILLADIGKKNSVTVTDDELRRAVFEQARNYPGQEQKVIEFYQKNRNALEQLKGPILEDKVVDFVISKVSITDKKVPAEELLKFDSAED
ncbi:MAG: trigger factor [Rickettsiaceae bacterium]|jgi:trigger factor|nr:trigger factor [Rickettsiaceae bacterium]